MSLEAITEIREVEERTERAKAEARAQAQKLAADAERDGKALLRQGQDDATAALAQALRGAEETAAQRRETILAEAAADCRKLKDAARGRMDQAVQAILERVVES